MKYRIEFSARLKFAIGLTYKQPVEIVEAESQEAAILKLYDRFEHVFVDKIEEIK